MALIKCPECGQMVSELAKSCIHCGAHLTNGQIKIKANINATIPNAPIKIYNKETNELLAEMKNKSVISLKITKDTPVIVKFLLYKPAEAILKVNGTGNYNLLTRTGFTRAQLQLNEVTNIDSD